MFWPEGILRMEACIVKDTICENNRQGGWIALNFRWRIRSRGKLPVRLSPFPGLSELSVHCAVRGAEAFNPQRWQALLRDVVPD